MAQSFQVSHDQGDVIVSVPMNEHSSRTCRLDLITHLGGHKYRLKSDQALIVMEFMPNGPNKNKEFLQFMKAVILIHNVYSSTPIPVPTI